MGPVLTLRSHISVSQMKMYFVFCCDVFHVHRLICIICIMWCLSLSQCFIIFNGGGSVALKGGAPCDLSSFYLCWPRYNEIFLRTQSLGVCCPGGT